MDKHHGQVIEKAIRVNGFNMSEAARELKIDRRTFYNWFKKKSLKDEVILKLAAVLRHDFSADFPEIYARAEKKQPISDPKNRVMKIDAHSDTSSNIDWRDKYIELLEKHTDLLSKNLFNSGKEK